MTFTNEANDASHSDAHSPDAGHGATPPVAVVGAGPAGLTAALELVRLGRDCIVYESDDVVGGISRTVERDGWRFDIGGHRFFTKVDVVDEMWHRILPDEDFLLRPRMSRIFYQGKLYDYPLKASNALGNLGVVEAAKCIGSYIAARIRPPKDQDNFEGWVAARFGWRLYRIFFKTYTEKVWGMDAADMPADWAAQRIKNLSLFSAIVNALFAKKGQTEITSLIDEFYYPKYGPGMMWERATEQVREAGMPVLMQTEVVALERDETGVRTVVTRHHGVEDRTEVSDVISSMPISALVKAMSPAAPDEVVRAADDLHYRDFLTVALVVPLEFSFPDNWIYIHDPGAKVGRVQNFGSWSPFLVKDGWTCLGLEYFVNEGDEMWTSPDDELIALATKEIEHLGLVGTDAVDRGYVVRMPKAYPVYDEEYAANVQVIRDFLESETPNVHPVGRNGMHRYNNADHSMLTAMLTVDNIVSGEAKHDVWTVNVEKDYHEERGASSGPGGTGRDAPVLPRRKSAV